MSIIVDDAPFLRQDQMLVSVDIDPLKGVRVDKEIEAWGWNCHTGLPIDSVKVRFLGDVANCRELTAANNYTSGCTQRQTMLLDKRSTSELWLRKPSWFFGIWTDVEILDSSIWQAFGGRSIRFFWVRD